MDIIGAAETGSGKTLAFGIPIIHGILLDKRHDAECMSSEECSKQEAQDFDASQDDDCLKSCPNGAPEEAISNGQSESDYEIDTSISDTESVNDMSENLGCVKVIDNADFSFMEGNYLKTSKDPSKKLRALIVTPTRELAIQVRCKMCFCFAGQF